MPRIDEQPAMLFALLLSCARRRRLRTVGLGQAERRRLGACTTRTASVRV